MKKILFCTIAIIGLATAAQAQVSGDFDGGSLPKYYTSLDTSTNTGDITWEASISNQRNSITIQVDNIAISGTQTSVTVKFYSSASGTNYATAPDFTDTLVAGSQTLKHTWTGNPNTKYKVVIDGVGTQVSSYKGWLLIR